METLIQLRGAVPVTLGLAMFVYAVGWLPRYPSDPEASEAWRTKWGPLLKNVGPMLAILGVLQFLGWL